jgi:hypothetical protein
MVAQLAGIPWPRGRTERARTRVRGETGNREVLATGAMLRGDASRQASVTARLAAETPATGVQEGTRVIEVRAPALAT